jgi:alanine racemase
VFEPRDLELCSRLGLWHTVHCDEQIDMLAMHKTQVPHRVFLKMNSGMNRLGFTPRRYRTAWTRLNALPQVDEISLMTHFSDADGPRGIAHQVAAFAGRHAGPAGRAQRWATAPPRCATRPMRPTCAPTGCAPGIVPCTAARPTSPEHTPATGACSPP